MIMIMITATVQGLGWFPSPGGPLRLARGQALQRLWEEENSTDPPQDYFSGFLLPDFFVKWSFCENMSPSLSETNTSSKASKNAKKNEK